MILLMSALCSFYSLLGKKLARINFVTSELSVVSCGELSQCGLSQSKVSLKLQVDSITLEKVYCKLLGKKVFCKLKKGKPYFMTLS